MPILQTVPNVKNLTNPKKHGRWQDAQTKRVKDFNLKSVFTIAQNMEVSEKSWTKEKSKTSKKDCLFTGTITLLREWKAELFNIYQIEN